MIILIIVAAVSLLFSTAIIYLTARFCLHHDTHRRHVQSIHTDHSSRFGGLSIFFSFSIGIALIADLRSPYYGLSLGLALASIPAFFIGISEDITAKIRAKIRLIVIAISSILFIYLFKLNAVPFGFDVINHIMHQSINSLPILIWIFIIFSLTGLTNAFNIIDGLNGLCASIAIFIACGLAYVAFKVNDFAIFYSALILIGSLAGFLFWNYPRGLIFLGDGGAYFIGFVIAGLSLLIVVRNPSVSPWFALLINIYPVFETIFSAWRRHVHQGRSSMNADLAHLHSLLYRRLLKWLNKSNKVNVLVNSDSHVKRTANSLTTTYLWALMALSIAPSIAFWNNTLILVIACLVFVGLYLYIYHTLTYSRKFMR